MFTMNDDTVHDDDFCSSSSFRLGGLFFCLVNAQHRRYGRVLGCEGAKERGGALRGLPSASRADMQKALCSETREKERDSDMCWAAACFVALTVIDEVV